MNAASAHTRRPPAWSVLHTALTHRRCVQAHYHGHQRLLCPHALGWRNHRAIVLCYQADGTTSTGPLPEDPTRRWRTLFIDELHDATLTDDPWQTADNYTPDRTGIDHLALAIHDSPRPP